MRTLVYLAISLLLAMPLAAENLVLVNGTIIDGTLAGRVRGNVRIRDGKIIDIGSFKPLAGEILLDVKDLVVAPGFIDLQNRSAAGLEKNLGAASQVMQGITTAVLGAGGRGPYAVEEFMSGFDETPPALNIMMFVGHGTVRRQIMGADYKRTATAREIQLMGELVENAMREGAFGLSSALESDPEFYSTTDELVALAQVVARYGGLFAIHLRDEGDKILDSVEEIVQIGRAVKIPIQLVDLKLLTPAASGKAAEVLAQMDKARTQKIDIAATMYPYDTWSEPVTILLTGSAPKALEDLGGPQKIRIIGYAKQPEYNFRTLSEIAAERNITPAELALELVQNGGAEIACSCLNEKDVRVFMQHPWVMLASDGGLGVTHPRSSGTFPRVLGKYARDEKLLPLERAVRKMTGLPASRIGLKERGVLKKGSPADIVVFDPAQIADSPDNPDWSAAPPPRGMKYVFVNGTMVVKDGQPTDARPGVALR
jgi:N-acyl-D-amino-acid deacylase